MSTIHDPRAHQGPEGNAGDPPARPNPIGLVVDSCPLCNSRGYKIELHSNHIYLCACSFGKKLQNGLAELARNSAK